MMNSTDAYRFDDEEEITAEEKERVFADQRRAAKDPTALERRRQNIAKINLYTAERYHKLH